MNTEYVVQHFIMQITQDLIIEMHSCTLWNDTDFHFCIQPQKTKVVFPLTSS